VTALRERAPAKINLFLAVGPPRPDGYHPIVTVFEAVPYYDDVEIDIRPKPPGEPWGFGAAAFRPDGSPLGTLPRSIDNLAARALKAFVEARLGADRPCSLAPAEMLVTLVKRIPVSAGLGGGSSDAAAVLRALETHYGDPPDLPGLTGLAAGLGSDVPFFVLGGRAVGRSRGEELTPLPREPSLPLVIGLPSFPLRTPDVYREFDRQGPDRWAEREGDLSRLLDALAAGDYKRLATCLRNDLEPAALALRPEIGEALAALRRAGCLAAQLSGSGPAVFGLAASGQDLAPLVQAARRALPARLTDRMTFVGLCSGA
jgi:4-diphosphocytidyl-2-C-methyl-D-erythritol kinase